MKFIGEKMNKTNLTNLVDQMTLTEKVDQLLQLAAAFYSDGCEKRQRWSLHNDQRINPRRRYNNYKYICTQHGSTAVCKTNANKYERRNRSEEHTSELQSPGDLVCRLLLE